MARLLTFALLLISVFSFENAKMRQRKRRLSEATGFLRLPSPGYDFADEDDRQCAACEALVREMESHMDSDKHKGGTVARLNMLVSLCDNIDRQIPLTLGEGDDEVLHFFPQKDMKDGARVGLSEWCTAMIEEFDRDPSETYHTTIVTTPHADRMMFRNSSWEISPSWSRSNSSIIAWRS